MKTGKEVSVQVWGNVRVCGGPEPKRDKEGWGCQGTRPLFYIILLGMQGFTSIIL